MKSTLRIGLVVVSILGVIQVFIPSEILFGSRAPSMSYSGKISGKALRFQVPNSKHDTVSLDMMLDMETGVCSITCVDPNGAENPLYSAIKATSRYKVPAGGYLVLDPGTNSGRYRINLGPMWHPLSPRFRVLFAVSSALGLLMSALCWRFKRNLFSLRLERKQLFYTVFIAILSVLLYAVVHELGHWFVGYLGGGTATEIVWTPLSGEEPHVSFGTLPEAVVPWMIAGGVWIPTIIGLALVLTWLIFSRRIYRPLGYALIIPGVLFLLSNVACLLPAGPDGHRKALSTALGLQGFAGTLVEFSPPIVTVAAYWCIFMKLRKRRSETTSYRVQHTKPSV